MGHLASHGITHPEFASESVIKECQLSLAWQESFDIHVLPSPTVPLPPKQPETDLGTDPAPLTATTVPPKQPVDNITASPEVGVSMSTHKMTDPRGVEHDVMLGKSNARPQAVLQYQTLLKWQTHHLRPETMLRPEPGSQVHQYHFSGNVIAHALPRRC